MYCMAMGLLISVVFGNLFMESQEVGLFDDIVLIIVTSLHYVDDILIFTPR